MNEAMSRREIEDVLTSIKRLVSQDVPARQTAREGSLAPTRTRPANAEKLLLTAELRVQEPDTPTPEAVTEPGEHPVETLPEPVPEPSAPPSLIRRIATAGGPPVFGAAPRHSQSAQPIAEDPRPETESPEQLIEDAALEATLARLEAMLAGDAKPAPATAPQVADEGTNDLPPNEQIIDESMLYQLVAQIVRQELQGELGEKITRNIRKLVRQEVARELQLRRDHSSFSG